MSQALIELQRQMASQVRPVKRSHKKKHPSELIRHPRKPRKLPSKSPKRSVSRPSPLSYLPDKSGDIKKLVMSQNSAMTVNKGSLDSLLNDSGSITTVGHVSKLLELVKSVFEKTGQVVMITTTPLMESVWGISYSLSTIFIQGLYNMGLYFFKHWMIGNIMFSLAFSMSSLVSSYLKETWISSMIPDVTFLPELKGSVGLLLMFGGGFVANMFEPVHIISQTLTNTADFIIGGPVRFANSKIASVVRQRYDNYGIKEALKFIGPLLTTAGLLWLAGPVMLSLLESSGIPGIFSVLQNYMSSEITVKPESEKFLILFLRQFMLNTMLCLETLGVKASDNEYETLSATIHGVINSVLGTIDDGKNIDIGDIGGYFRSENGGEKGSPYDIVYSILKGVASMLKGTSLIAILIGQVTVPAVPEGDALEAWGNNMDTTLLVPSMIHEAMGKGNAGDFITEYKNMWKNNWGFTPKSKIYKQVMDHWAQVSKLPIGNRVFVCIKVLASYIGSCFSLISAPLRSLGGIAIATLLVGLAWRHLNKPGPVNKKDFEKLVEIYGYHVIVMNAIQKQEHKKDLDVLVALYSKNIKALKGVTTISKLYSVMSTENAKLQTMLSNFMNREPGSYADTEYIDRALPIILKTLNQYSIELQLLIKDFQVEKEANINNAQLSLMNALDIVEKKKQLLDQCINCS